MLWECVCVWEGVFEIGLPDGIKLYTRKKFMFMAAGCISEI